MSSEESDIGKWLKVLPPNLTQPFQLVDALTFQRNLKENQV